MKVLHSRALLAAFTILAACAEKPDDSGAEPTVTRGVIPDDAVFVVNGGDSTISVVDQSSNGVVATIELRGVQYPHHVNLDAAGDRMLIGVPGIDLSGGHGGHEAASLAPKDMKEAKGAVLMLDARTGALLDFQELDGTNHNAAFAAGDTEVWTTEWNGSRGDVVVLGADDLEPMDRIEVDEMPTEVTFSLDGARAFVCNRGSGTVSVIDVATKMLLADIAVGETPVGAWPARDGVMYVDNEGSQSISALDSTTLMVTHTYELGFTPGMAALAPTNELWVTDSDAGRVVAFDPLSTEDLPVRTIVVEAGAHAIAFSTDEKRAYVTNQGAGTLSIIDVATGDVISTLAVGHKPNGMAVRAQ